MQKKKGTDKKKRGRVEVWRLWMLLPTGGMAEKKKVKNACLCATFFAAKLCSDSLFVSVRGSRLHQPPTITRVCYRELAHQIHANSRGLLRKGK